MSVNMKWSSALLHPVRRGKKMETEVSLQNAGLLLQDFTNPAVKIHVQNVPFVCNPDTTSVGLGFSKEENDWWDIIHLKYQEMLCSIVDLSCNMPFTYLFFYFFAASHQRAVLFVGVTASEII